MWTKINQVYASPHQMNAWAHLVGTNKWHKVKPIATDGVTNTFLILATAKGADRQGVPACRWSERLRASR